MARGKHKAIAIGPGRVVGIVAQNTLPQRVNHRRHRHWRAGMPRFRRFDRIHRERADGVDGKLIYRNGSRAFHVVIRPFNAPTPRRGRVNSPASGYLK